MGGSGVPGLAYMMFLERGLGVHTACPTGQRVLCAALGSGSTEA